MWQLAFKKLQRKFLQCCLPTALILLFLWTYYAYVVELCILKVASVLKKVLYLFFYHFCFILVTIFYFTSMFIGNAMVPSNYRLTILELEAIRRLPREDRSIDIILERFCHIRGIRTYTRTNNRIRYCLKCNVIKPDRTHHCSNCKVCVLKMDHHCPWLDNCVGFYNYKFFFLLLLYTSLYCFYYAGTSAEYVYIFCIDEEMRELRQLNYVTGFGVTILLGIGMVSLLCFHIGVVLRNETTLESMTEPVFTENCSFDLGKYYNFAEVFGYNCIFWFLPIRSSLGNGVVFPVRFD